MAAASTAARKSRARLGSCGLSGAAALLSRGLSPLRPVMILSANAIDHALLMLAAYTAGIPVAPVSVAPQDEVIGMRSPVVRTDAASSRVHRSCGSAAPA